MATSSIQANNNSSDNSFDILFEIINNNPLQFEVYKHNGNDIHCCKIHRVSTELKQQIYDLVYKCFRCVTCARNAKRCSVYSANGISLLANENILQHVKSFPQLNSFYEELYQHATNAIKCPIINIVAIDKNNFNKKFGLQNCGGFDHIVPSIKMLKSYNTRFYQAVFDRYLRTNQLNRLIALLLDQEGGLASAIKSIELMDVCCKEAPYGDTFIGTVLWLKTFLIKLRDEYKGVHLNSIDQTVRWSTLVEFIFAGNIASDFSGTVCTSYHQAKNNVIDLMGCAESKEAMVKMLTTRLTPTNYKRTDTTKVLSPQKIQIAVNVLGDFTNTLMTLNDAKQLPGAVSFSTIVPPDVTSSTSGFASMLKESTSVKKGFAERAKPTIADISKITTLWELTEYIKINPSTIVSINVYGLNTLKLVDTTLAGRLDKDGDPLIKVPYFWSFNGFNTSLLSSGYHEVSLIVPMMVASWKNVFFALKVKYPSDTVVDKNCCFPDFLTTKYERVARAAFEKLDTSVKLVVPPGPLSDMAIGVGTSSSDRDGKMHRPLCLKINGIEKTIFNMGWPTK